MERVGGCGLAWSLHTQVEKISCDAFVRVPSTICIFARTRVCVHMCCARMLISHEIGAPAESVPTMSCVICLVSSPDARHSCSCSARTCPACLLQLLDRGADRCVVCGSRFRQLAVVRACLYGVQTSGSDSGDLTKAKAHGKLAVAYSGAGRHADALQSLAIALRHAAPGSLWQHFLKLESAQNLLSIGRTDEARRCLVSVMPTLLQLPTSLPEASLHAHCCMLLAKTNVQNERRAAAKSWLRRAIRVQGEFGLQGPLATTMQLYSELLSRDHEHQEAKAVLQDAERIMERYETDVCPYMTYPARALRMICLHMPRICQCTQLITIC